MAEVVSYQPRWGNERRDHKAAAILATLRHICGTSINHGRWLDVGCGSGRVAATLALQVEHVTGIDPEPWSAWEEAIVTNPNLQLLVGVFDVEALPMPLATVDVVVCNQVYEHVRDPSRLIANLFRVMRPGGTCYFAGPNLLWPVEPHVFWPAIHWFPRRFAQWLMRRAGSHRADELDAYSYAWFSLRRWFREAGFEVRWALRERFAVELQLRGWFKLATWIDRLPAWVFAVLEPITPGFIYVLHKPEGTSETAGRMTKETQ